jgi:hypothetical protein
MFSFLKVLFGTGVSECLECGGQKTEGAAVVGHHRFVTSPLLSFLFFLAMFSLLPQHFIGCELLYRCVCYIYIAGRKPVSREIGISSKCHPPNPTRHITRHITTAHTLIQMEEIGCSMLSVFALPMRPVLASP